MANCPNCGSSHIQLKRETDVNWGRAVVGWAVFGVVGGAVGAVTGEDRNVNACLDCGTSWKAGDLHKLLQIIQKLTNLRLNLANEADRIFINDFISEFSGDLEAISNIKKQDQERIKAIESNSRATASGCAIGCLGSIIVFTISLLITITGDSLGLIILGLPIIGFAVGWKIDEANKESITQEVERVKQETEIKVYKAEENLRAKLVKFVENHPLNNDL